MLSGLEKPTEGLRQGINGTDSERLAKSSRVSFSFGVQFCQTVSVAEAGTQEAEPNRS